MEAATAGRPASLKLVVALLLGAAVAVGLGIYGHVHDPTGKLVFTLFFTSTISMKVWLGTVAVAFAVVQVTTALWIYGKLPWQAPGWAGDVHRISGRLAFLFSLPVAYHCLWSLGFQNTDARVLAHSVLGCAFYGAFATKITIVRSRGLPGVALPIVGGLTFAVLVAVWFTSAYWFIGQQGWPSP
jgi:hypothetical protein